MSGSTLQSSIFQRTSASYCDGRMAGRWAGEVKFNNESLGVTEPGRDDEAQVGVCSCIVSKLKI